MEGKEITMCTMPLITFTYPSPGSGVASTSIEDDDLCSVNGYGSDDDRDSIVSYASTVDTTFDEEGMLSFC